MEAVCLAVNFCLLKRKEPLEVIRINALLAVIPKANSHKSTGLHHPQRKWVLGKPASYGWHEDWEYIYF